ncbi:MAG: GNAT family N-acetyltransferase [Candidatus Marinimicrobia bacterium]|nr:GNAT family N-acetyltransferase [Candidatus Neomarinimicrobiota bacterium]MCF7921809.1 GNAT family N-acetyltransferase [Candidatus Neomarinimicrobiota bacterium]
MKVYLETQRMILREFTEADVDLLVDLDSDPEVTRFINGGKPTPHDYISKIVMPKILEYYKNDNGLGIWACLDKNDQAFMGWLLLRPSHSDPSETELGYRFKQKYWGKGVATEGSAALVKKGFEELHVAVIMATADPANDASRRVMEKVGLRFEKELTEPDGFVVLKYRLDRKDYFKQKAMENSAN